MESVAESVYVLIIFALAGTCLFLFYRLYLPTKKEEAKSKVELKQKLAEMEMKVLRAQMNPHFIFNSLNSINRYIVKLQPDTASAYLTKFAKLMRLILENSNHKLISLDQELTALKLYVELESMRFNQKFSYTFAVDPAVDQATFGIPPMIFQPFIENAIWHGLLHKEAPGTLEVSVKRSGTGIQCIIQDNGIGRKKAAELKSKSINSDKSYGMKITTDRLRLTHNNNRFSTIEIKDLEDSFGNAMGTKVILEIAPGEIEEY